VAHVRTSEQKCSDFLAEAADYKNAPEWFSKHLVDLSEPALKMYGAVAEAFSEDVTRRFGMLPQT